jgi:cysteine desulfurase / selenocysteine lyase
MNISISIPKALDITAIRQEFPILSREVKGRPLIYLDNAATSQKPKQVIEALVHYYSNQNANIHRGIHSLAEEATAAFELTRDAVKSFIGARFREEIIFTKGTTESINLVAYAWGRKNIQAGDEIIISTMEHHSNIVPWQILCDEKKALLKIIPVNETGELVMQEYEKMLGPKTRLVSIMQVSNALGTVNPVKRMAKMAHQNGALIMVDGAQSAVHLDIDVQDLDCDFFAFSAHKLYGPTGVGVLYGRKEILEAMPPFLGGGEMIKEVHFEKTTFNDLPYKFEGGTPNIGDVIAFRSAIEFIQSIGKDKIHRHEQELLEYAQMELEKIPGLTIIGRAREKVGVISFIIAGAHPQDIGILLDNRGIAVRTGHHCAQPLMDRFGIPGTARASLAVYNTQYEIDELVKGLQRAVKILA